MDTTDQLLDVGEVCRIFGVTRQTVNRWVKAGHLVAIQPVPRAHLKFRRVDVEALLTPKPAA